MRATGQSVFTVWCGHHSKNKKLIPNVHHFVYTINTTNALCVCGCLSNWLEYWSQNRWTTRCTKLLDLNATAPIGNCIDLCEIARPPDKIQSQYMCCAPANKSVCIVYFRSKSLHMIMRVWRWSCDDVPHDAGWIAWMGVTVQNVRFGILCGWSSSRQLTIFEWSMCVLSPDHPWAKVNGVIMLHRDASAHI